MDQQETKAASAGGGEHKVQSKDHGAHYGLYHVSVLGQEEGYTVKYTPPPEGVPKGKA